MGRPKGALGKQKKKQKDTNKPKRAISAYFVFLAECRTEAAQLGKPLTKIAEFTKLASEKWKALTAEQKRPYEAQAAIDKKRYEEEMAIYKGKTVDPNKPKRPPTAYFLFLADFRPRMAGSGIEHKELLKKAGEEWRNMPAHIKGPYEKRALEESKKYEIVMAEYRRTGGGLPQQAMRQQPVLPKKPKPEEEDDDDDEEDDDDDDDEDDDDDDE
ncbi:high mobility group protein 1 [Plakobranchus ocellatus]|uniref:High mobility group protein 1 n=1 Tax=Plakobranchus ocellatus TaxID=259542 RepID=A0AAV3Z8V3_9GAST|nr:high mobility group protein 1 [Plakobranchus ocellatus]